MNTDPKALPVLQTDALTRMFGAFTAVDRLSLEVRRGETYGFLGPNGAGKTTTLMMLAGVLKPTSGGVRLFGRRLADDPFALKRRIGVVIEAQSYYDEMTAWEYLMFFVRLYGAQDGAKRGQTLLERLGLWEWRNTLVGGFSTGMQRKLALVRALLHTPELLILDEPVASLDPFSVKQVRELLLDERAAGRTILISSHILSEVERTADRVGIIARGRLLFEDTMSSLRLKLGSGQIEIELDGPPIALEAELRALPFVTGVRLTQGRLAIGVSGERDRRGELSRFLNARGATIIEMRAIAPSLEDAFITITETDVAAWSGAARG
jgi:ABC-2 type transport system ATP-binding protein